MPDSAESADRSSPSTLAPLRILTRSIGRSAGSLFSLLAIGAVFCVGLELVILEREESVVNQRMDGEHRDAEILSRIGDLQRKIQIDIVEVQQFLTDFSATRGRDGLDDGIAAAEVYADRFHADLMAAEKAAQDFGSHELVSYLGQLPAAFDTLHKKGLAMARAYASGGTDAGNVLMPAFDKASDDLLEQVDRAQAALDLAKTRRAEADAVSHAELEALRSNARLNIIGLGVVTILSCLAGFALVRRWIVEPVRALKARMARLRDGEIDDPFPPQGRGDEIGEMAETLEFLRLGLVERRKQEQESRLIGEFIEWLQSAESVTELYRMIADCVSRLLPDCGGGLYIFSHSRDVLEGVADWNGAQVRGEIHPEDCWSLRRGRAYDFGTDRLQFVCNHIDGTADHCYSCMPILAHGETIGMLHIAYGETRGGVGALWQRQKKLAMVCAEQISLSIANAKLREQLRDQSIRDVLTGLYNRRYLLEAASREFSRAGRSGTPVSMVSIDVDHFKRFNDNHGHDAGDMVLRAVAECLDAHFSKGEIVCRFGGEEFVVALPGIPAEVALARVDELRRMVEARVVRYLDAPLPTITLSAGVAALAAHGETLHEVLKAADDALYLAKQRGRNRVVLSGEGRETPKDPGDAGGDVSRPAKAPFLVTL